MSVSVLLRLAPQALALGRLAGRAEIVETGEATEIRDGDELLAFLRRRPDPRLAGAEKGRRSTPPGS